MPYLNLKDSLPEAQFQYWWELRVHIDPSVLHENYRVNQITSILHEVFGQDKVGLKIYSIVDEQDRTEGYDGALCHTGKDRTQVGKEIGIYLPDELVVQLSAEQYKQKLLVLWKKFQEQKIPLMYLNVPGDQGIRIDGSLPSPFSFTSQNPKREEWLDKHGILLKEFEAHGKHPILDVHFTMKDLKKYKIKVDKAEVLRTMQFLNAHREEVIQDIEKHKIEFNRDNFNASEFFQNSGTLYQLIDECIHRPDLDKRNHIFKILDAYPRYADRDFSRHSAVNEIRATLNKTLTLKQADALLNKLCDEFPIKAQVIQEDFKTIQKHFARIFSWIENDNHLQPLFYKNPVKMQAIFRQLAHLKREEEFNPKASVEIQLLNLYKNGRAKIDSNYTGFFGRINRIFGACSKQEKVDGVDELIKRLNQEPGQTLFNMDAKHVKPLTQGDLGEMIKDLNINLTRV